TVSLADGGAGDVVLTLPALITGLPHLEQVTLDHILAVDEAGDYLDAQVRASQADQAGVDLGRREAPVVLPVLMHPLGQAPEQRRQLLEPELIAPRDQLFDGQFLGHSICPPSVWCGLQESSCLPVVNHEYTTHVRG